MIELTHEPHTDEAKEEARAQLEKLYPGDVYDTDALLENFIVESFLYPCVFVKRRYDGEPGTLSFIHMPRLYYNFVSQVV